MYAQGEYVTPANYAELKSEMRSFDLLMFRGDDIVSDTIAEVQKNDQFTHAGLVIHSSLLSGWSAIEPNKLYVFESTYTHEIPEMNLGPPDYLTGKQFFGVHLRDLETVCSTYIKNDKTKIAWFPLQFTIDIPDFPEIFKRYHLRPFLHNTLDRQIIDLIDMARVTPDVMKMAKVIITPLLIETVLKSSFSCVNLVTAVYQDIGLISKETSLLYPMDLLTMVPVPIMAST